MKRISRFSRWGKWDFAIEKANLQQWQTKKTKKDRNAQEIFHSKKKGRKERRPESIAGKNHQVVII